MSKRIKLTEKQINKAINEISYDTVDNATSKSHNLFFDVQSGTMDNDWDDGFDNFYSKLLELQEILEQVEPNLYQGGNFDIYHPSKNNPYLNKIHHLLLKIGDGLSEVRNVSDELNNLLERKKNQRDYFDDAIRKYDKAHQNDDLSDEEYGNGEINNV